MRRGAAILGAVGVLVVSGPAFAAHGKAGLWDLSVTVSAPGMDHPQVVSNQHCMTAGEVASPGLSAPSQSGCSMQNAQTEGTTLSGDLVCTGEHKGSGHMTVTYDSPEHYSGTMTFTSTADDGTSVAVSQKMEGRWVSASCGNVMK